MPRMTQAELDAFNARRNRGSDSPQSVAADAGEESELHDRIIAECRRRGWFYVHARMDKRSTLTPGTPDFVIFTDCGGVLIVECKTRTGKMSVEQSAVAAMLKRLGHRSHVVRSFEDFAQLSRCGRFATGKCDGKPFMIEVAPHETMETLKRHFASTVGSGNLTDVVWHVGAPPTLSEK